MPERIHAINGFADPQAGIGYAYVTNRMGAKIGGDPRELTLREAFLRSAGLELPGPLQI